jgi:hypothetical protein
VKIVGFFAAFYLYVWLRVEPQVEYQHLAPAFQFSVAYLKPFLGYPGGLLDYAATSLAQLNYYPHLGAFSLTTIALLSYLAAFQILRRLKAFFPEAIAYATPFVMVLLKDRFYSPAASVYLGLLLSLGLAAGYVLTPWRKTWLRLGLYWLTSVALYFVAGPGPCALFAVVCTLSHVVRARQWLLALACGLSLLILPVGARFIDQTARPQLLWGNPMPEKVSAGAYLSLSLLATLLALLPGAMRRRNSSEAQGKPAKTGAAPPWFQTNLGKQAVTWAFLCLGWGAVWFSFDRHRKTLAEIDYYSSRSEFTKVLAAAASAKRLDAPAEIRLHRALYHTGRLADDLFSFTNQTIWALMPALKPSLNACRAQSESALELGQVVMAEHFAHEAMEWEGPRPEILLLLSRINSILDRPQAARIFLNVLRQVPFQRQSAEACLRDLEKSGRLLNEMELKQVRGCMVTYDQPHVTVPPEGILLESLDANPTNRMAFEYLMTHFLLTRQVDRLVQELKRMKDFQGTEIPRHYEEALLLHQRKNGGANMDLQGRQIRPATLQRFREFAAAMQRGTDRTAEGKAALARDFGDTFWLYCISGRPASLPIKDSESEKDK